MAIELSDLLTGGGTVLADGATGTQMFKLGLSDGNPPDSWNDTLPENVLIVHRQYIEAGAQIILTNTFGGTTFRLKLHNLQDQSEELSRKGAALARQAADEYDWPVFVAGSIGPTGEILKPMGNMSYEQGVESFAIQAKGLHDGGADIFWIETMSDLDEVRAAVEGIRQVSDRPICATMTFDTKGRTMMGVSPQEAARRMSEWGLFAFGANCGNGIDEIEAVVELMHTEVPDALLIAKSNAGMPQWSNNELKYDGTPDTMAEYAQRVRSLGASIIGGCCGSAPEHITAMKNALAVDAGERVIDARGFKVADVSVAELSAANGSNRKRRRKAK
ncbi:MAG: methionine synthase I (cobalamin-dependent) [Cellvibrionaceae bacterium]|jgi:methionine synthase I (cobalamin-dependent)